MTAFLNYQLKLVSYEVDYFCIYLWTVTMVGVSQQSKQIIGQFPTMDGGFENMTDSVLSVSSIISGGQSVKWTTTSSLVKI